MTVRRRRSLVDGASCKARTRHVVGRACGVRCRGRAGPRPPLSSGSSGLKVFLASRRPAAVQRSAISALRQRLTLRCTVLTVPSAFSIALVQASARRSSGGRPRRMTVRPSRMVAETPGASCSRRRARLLVRLQAGRTYSALARRILGERVQSVVAGPARASRRPRRYRSPPPSRDRRHEARSGRPEDPVPPAGSPDGGRIGLDGATLHSQQARLGLGTA